MSLAVAAWAGPGAAGAAGLPVIHVEDTRRAQPILGVGAAVTNSAAFLIEQELGSAARDDLLRTLFDPSRDGLSLVRVPIGGTDFNYGGVRFSEDDVPAGQTDPLLGSFSLVHDWNTIALLRAARAINPAIRVVASPWSAPAWMKTNGSLENVGFAGHLQPAFYPSYAAYLVRFAAGYAAAGVPIWALTVANEPSGVAATYEGMSMPPSAEARFITGYLRPALRRAGLHIRVLALDASWDGAGYARRVLGPHGRGADGVAWHCYTGDADAAMARFPGELQILDECAPNLIDGVTGVLLSDVFSAGASGAALWNLALDPSGGPVVAPNQNCQQCTGLVTVDPADGQVTGNPDLATLATFGHALEPGAVRIAATPLGHFDPRRHDRATAGLHDVAFRDPGGQDALLVADEGPRRARFTIRWRAASRTVSVAGHDTVAITWSRRAGGGGLARAAVRSAAGASG